MTAPLLWSRTSIMSLYHAGFLAASDTNHHLLVLTAMGLLGDTGLFTVSLGRPEKQVGRWGSPKQCSKWILWRCSCQSCWGSNQSLSQQLYQQWPWGAKTSICCPLENRCNHCPWAHPPSLCDKYRRSSTTILIQNLESMCLNGIAQNMCPRMA